MHSVLWYACIHGTGTRQHVMADQILDIRTVFREFYHPFLALFAALFQWLSNVIIVKYGTGFYCENARKIVKVQAIFCTVCDRPFLVFLMVLKMAIVLVLLVLSSTSSTLAKDCLVNRCPSSKVVEQEAIFHNTINTRTLKVELFNDSLNNILSFFARTILISILFKLSVSPMKLSKTCLRLRIDYK